MSSANRAHSMGTFGGKGMAMATRRLLAAAILAAGSAAASDRPHYPEPAVPIPLFPANTCAACHKPHGASGGNLTSDTSNTNLCRSCHTSKSPGPGIGTWVDSDQANPGTSGSSHNYSAAGAGTANPRVATYNITAPPASSLVKLGAGNVLQCSSCHDQHSQMYAPADPNAPPYPADATVTEARRHYSVTTNSTAEMCVECHTGWKQSTVTSATWVGTTPSGYRSHPVVNKDNLATPTKLIMNAAGTGTSDRTYKQIPHDMPMRVTLTASQTTTINFNASAPRLAANALAGWSVRFLGGTQKNVVAQITGNTATSATLATALAAAPAAGTIAEIDRVSYGYYAADWDVATSSTANAINNTGRTWATTGNNSPTAGAGTVTILASGPTGTADVGKTCTIASNTATALTLSGTGCTTLVPMTGGTVPNALVYRINWRLAGSGTTTAAGSTTTFVDNTKTLWPANGPVGLQVRFLASNATARITAWNNTTFTATFAPAVTTADTASGAAYQLEPAQVGPFAGAVVSGSTTGGFTTATNLFGAGASNNAQNTLLRFTSGTHRGEVTKILTNTASAVTFTTVAGTAPAVGDTFEIDLDGNSTNNAWLGGTAPTFSNPATGQVTCMSCHGAHYADSDAGTYDDVGRTGDGHLLRRGWNSGATDEVCGACHATQIHSSLTVGSKYGAWGTANTCTTCHQPHLTGNVLLVKPTITRPDSTATVAIDFRDAANGQAPNAMVNGPLTQTAFPFYTSGNGPCEACHTQTRNGLLYTAGTGGLGTGTATTNGTTAVSCVGTCNFNARAAAGWEFKLVGDPVTSWTRIASATATTITLAVAYPRSATGAAYELANPRFRTASAQRGTGATAGSGRGVAAADHSTATCTNCHSHSTGFKASCTSCHGTEGRASPVSHAPPKDSLGNTAATGGTAPNRVGAHLAHLGQKGAGALSDGVACSECHLDPPARADHPPAAVPNPVRRALLSWGPLATAKLFTGDPTPVPVVTQSAGAVATCSATFCHGNFKNGNTTNPAISWAGTAACGSCHGATGAPANPTPKTSAQGGSHPGVNAGQNCGLCHPGYNFLVGTGPQGTTNGVNPATHVDGKLDGGGDCVVCHTAGGSAVPARRDVVSEFKQTWSHKASTSATPASRTVSKWDCVVCHMEGNAATADPDPVYHPMTAGGVINLRDPDTGQHVKRVTFTAASGTNNAGAYATTTVDMTFTRFSRNLGVPLESDPSLLVLGAIMTNQCLKCHDLDGAVTARVPTSVMPNASAGKPFGTTIAGAGYLATTGHTACKTAGANNDGCVTDVNASFDTGNSSYHPVRGKQNNSYVTATRMAAPWTGITKTAGTTTNWGYLISCWDCHAPNGVASTVTLTGTVTAHGGAATLRGAVWSTTSPLCKACHVTGQATNGTHGTGSAFAASSGINSGMATYVNNQCHHCHSSSTTASRPGRPVPGQDAHGFNAFTSAMAATGDNLWPVGTTNTWRPYAFMRAAGSTATWRGANTYARPRSGIDLPALTTGNCSGNPGGTNCSNTMGTYTPGGVY